MSSTRLAFFGPIGKQDGHPGLWLAKTFLAPPLKLLNRIQWNLTGSKISISSNKFVFFRLIGKTRWPPWRLVGWDTFKLILWNCGTEFNETWQEARSQRPPPSMCFSGWSEKQDGYPGLWLAETFSTSPRKLLNCFNETWQEARSQCPLPNLCIWSRSEKQSGRPGLWLA